MIVPRRRLRFVVVIAALASVLMPGSAAATYNTPPWADVMSGPMWGGVDPRGDAANAIGYLKSMGYRTFDDNNNTTPAQAIGPGWAQSDGVWVAMGHGNAGLIIVESGATGGPPSPKIAAVYANSSVPVTPDSYVPANRNLYSLPLGKLRNVRLMVFFACNTGNDGKAGSPWNGNLVDEAYNDQYVTSAIGFRYEIRFIAGADATWSDGFFHSLQVGQNVQAAADQGLANVHWLQGWFYNSYGFDNPKIAGGWTTIAPAANGNR